MANGDIASTVGWTTYAATQQRSQGYDNDNYALDRAAEQFITLRDQVLPAVNQPVFAVRRANSGRALNNTTWTQLLGAVYAAPLVADGFASWANGQLKIAKAGLYRINVRFGATVQQDLVAVQVVRNTALPDTAAGTLVKNDGTGFGAIANGIVRLAVGDVLSVLGLMTSAVTVERAIGYNPWDLELDVEWIRA